MYNSNRGGIIQIIIGIIFVLITVQLISLQIFSSKYVLAANNNAIFRKIIIRTCHKNTAKVLQIKYAFLKALPALIPNECSFYIWPAVL